jgi:hypothetical protein
MRSYSAGVGQEETVTIWDHRYTDAAQYTEDGLSHLATGMGAARLHAIRARALAGHRDFAQARAAIAAGGITAFGSADASRRRLRCPGASGVIAAG